MLKSPVPEFPEPDDSSFHSYLKCFLKREMDGMTLTTLARKLQLTPKHLSNLDKNPSSELVDRYIVNLRRDPNWQDSFAAELQRQAELQRKRAQGVEDSSVGSIGLRNHFSTAPGDSIASTVPPISNAEESSVMTIDSSKPKRVLLLTCNRHETHAVNSCFYGGKVPPLAREDEFPNLRYRDLGLHGKHHVFSVVAPGLGSTDAQGTVTVAIQDIKPDVVIAVGIAFGANPRIQKIGDVLISNSVQGYELGRLEPNGTFTPRDTNNGACPLGIQIFRDLEQNSPPRGYRYTWPTIHIGKVLSGSKLVDNVDFRDYLMNLWPDAIGGEMEAVGVVAATQYSHTPRPDWVIVKAICDWGYLKASGTKEEDQALAAFNAALVVKAALHDQGLAEIGPHPARALQDEVPKHPSRSELSKGEIATSAKKHCPTDAQQQRNKLIAKFKASLAAAFVAGCWDQQTPVLPAIKLTDERIPSEIEALMRANGNDLGERLLVALTRITSLVGEALRTNRDGLQTSLRGPDKHNMVESLQDAMGYAARLCINLAALQTAQDAITVPNTTEEVVASVLARENSSGRGWTLVEDPVLGLPVLKDRHTIHPVGELGDAAHAENEILRLLLSKLNSGLPPPQLETLRFSASMKTQFLARLEQMARQQRTFLMFIEPNQRDIFEKEKIRTLTKDCHLGLVVLRPPHEEDEPLFFLAEHELLSRLNDFVELISQPEWTVQT